MKKRKGISILLCAAMVLGIVGSQILTGIAEPECTCTVMVHGSNCPLSQCSCTGKETGEHAAGCPLFGKPAELLRCVCQADVHGEGCPRFHGEGQLLDEQPGEEVGPEPAPGTAEAPDKEPAQPEESGQPEDPSTPGENGQPETPPDPDPGPSEGEGDQTQGEAAPSPDEPQPGSKPEGMPGEEGEAQEPVTGPEEEPTDQEKTPAGQEEPPADQLEPPQEPAADPEEEPIGELEPPEEEPQPEWEYPSNWEGYGAGQMRGNLTVAAEAFTLDGLLKDHIGEVRGALKNGNNARLVQDGQNFADVLAVYAVLSGQTENYPYGVRLDSQDAIDELHSVYWSMTQVTGVSNKTGAAISVKRLTASEAAKRYGFSGAQRQALSSLAGQDGTVEDIVNESVFATLTDAEFANLGDLVPEGISADRRGVLMAAVALDGKVDYFWGGKSLAYGWDDRWGEMRTVTSEGSETYGTGRPLGLDCSGFVSWAFLNAYSRSDAIADGSSNQWQDSYEVAWQEAKPGDIVFYHPPSAGETNHVGIVLTVGESGPERIVHCGSGGVRVSGTGSFAHLRRPLVYGE